MRRAQETRLAGTALRHDERDRTRPIHPIRLPSTGRRPRIAGMPARGGGPHECVEGTLDWSPLLTETSAAPAGVAVAPAAGLTVAGRYRLSRLLGAGGMGTVWLADDVVLGRAVALKKITNHQRADGTSALQEARAAARITHPGVVRVYDLVPEDDGDWIVMEALPGQPLSTIIRERGRLPVDEVTQIALQLLSALGAVHDVDLVHRDIKPSNVQVCGAGRVVITDFGLSSASGTWGGLLAGEMAGSLPYMAPETLVDGAFGPPSDLYALGVTLYIAVEGHPPFDPAEPMSLLDSVLSARPRPTRHAGALRAVLDGLLEKDPGRRMDAARAREHLQVTPLAATPSLHRSRHQPPVRRRRPLGPRGRP